jgi:hypothetical protein
MRFSRQFLYNMWPIQLVFLLFIECRIFLFSLTPCNILHGDKIGLTDTIHPSLAPHLRTFQVFLIYINTTQSSTPSAAKMCRQWLNDLYKEAKLIDLTRVWQFVLQNLLRQSRVLENTIWSTGLTNEAMRKFCVYPTQCVHDMSLSTCSGHFSKLNQLVNLLGAFCEVWTGLLRKLLKTCTAHRPSHFLINSGRLWL